MDPSSVPIGPEELVRHAGFVRALATRLLRSEDDAEDLAHDALATALRTSPRERARLRAWFSRVMHRLVLQRRRENEARIRRESAIAASEEQSATIDLAAREEILRRVADAVCALPESHRIVILLRFYEDLPTRRVAERLGLPFETTRSRLKRAIDLLRAELDRGARGGREEWTRALALMSGVQASRSVALSVASHTLALKVAVGVAVMALVGGVWLENRLRRRAPSPASAPVAVAPAQVGPLIPREDDPVRQSVTEPAVAVAAELDTVRFTGRVVNSLRAPISGASVHLELRTSGAAEPSDGSDAATNENGEFAIKMPAKHVLDWSVTATADGATTIRREGEGVSPGEARDLGDIMLERCGTLSVGIIAGDGRLLRARGSIEIRRADSTNVVTTRQDFTIGADHLRFEVTDTPPGNCIAHVSLRARPSGELEAPVTVRSGETTMLDLPYDGPDPGTTISLELVDDFDDQSRSAEDLLPHLRFDVSDGTAVDARVSSDPAGGREYIILTATTDATIAVGSDEPEHVYFEESTLHRGQSTKAFLNSQVGLVVRLVGGSTQWPPDTQFIWETHLGESMAWDARSMPSKLAGANPPKLLVASRESGEMLRFPPGILQRSDMQNASYALAVVIPGRPMIRRMLSLEETLGRRLIEVEWPERSGGCHVRGEVIESQSNRSVADCEVQLFAPAELNDSAQSELFNLNYARFPGRGFCSSGIFFPAYWRCAIARTRTDSRGHFEFRCVARGRWFLRAIDSSYPYCDLVSVETGAPPVAPNEDEEVTVSIAVSTGATIRGRLKGPDGASFSGLTVKLDFEDARRSGLLNSERPGSGAKVSSEGEFEIGRAPHGSLRLIVQADALTDGLFGNGGPFGRRNESGIALLDPVEVPCSGGIDVEFAAQGIVPGFLMPTVVMDSKPTAGLLAAAVPLDAGGTPNLSFATDEHGLARVGPLLPGRYRVAITPPTHQWLFVDPDPIELQPGGAVEHRLEIGVVERKVTLIDDATSEPLPWTNLRIATRIPDCEMDDDQVVIMLGVDARSRFAGRLDLTLPPGDLLIQPFLKNGDLGEITKCRWPPDPGAPNEIRLH